MSKKAKKVNPRRRPATQADVNKAKREAQSKAVNVAWAIMFTVLRDKCGYGPVRLGRIWNWVNALSEEIAEGRVSVKDLMDTLADEADIVLIDAATGGNQE